MSDQVRYNQGFAAVPDEFIKDPSTTSYHIAIYAAIAMHANSDQRAWPSMKRLADLIGASRSKVKSAINELVGWGWITKEKRWNVYANRYDANIYYLSRSLQGRAPGDRGVGHQVTQGRAPGDQEPDPLNQTHKNQSVETKIADAVIDYLNAKADRSYRHTKSSREHILARLREGFTQAECEKVVDNKIATWKGDAKMDQYLRPSTLFAPSKFEAYLNEKPKKPERVYTNELPGTRDYTYERQYAAGGRQ